MHHDRVIQGNLLTTVTRVDLVIFSAIFGGSKGYSTWGSDGCSGVVGCGSCCARNGGRCVLSSRRADTDIGIGNEVRTVHVDCWIVADQLGETDAMRGSYSCTRIPWLDKVRRARPGETTVKLIRICGLANDGGQRHTVLVQRIDLCRLGISR